MSMRSALRRAVSLGARVGVRTPPTASRAHLDYDVVAALKRHNAYVRGTVGPAKLAAVAARGHDPLLVDQRTRKARAEQRLVEIITKEIERRGGETEILARNQETTLRMIQRAAGLQLVGADGWRRYGSRHQWAALRYLSGVDDNGRWAVRVPGTVDTVQAALSWLEPAPVTKAREAGRIVARQGDVYAVQTLPKYDGQGELPVGHVWDSFKRELRHEPRDGKAHQTLTLPIPVRFYRQRTYQMGRRRRARWGGGD